MGEKNKRTVSLSVHDLVDFLLREGDIDNRVYNQDTMKMGTLLHSVYQQKQGKSYLSEVYLKETFDLGECFMSLEGRADGIIIGGKYPVIDEIKSTIADIEEFHASQKRWHLGQALCYALMYLHENSLSEADIRLTYISQNDTKIQKIYQYHYSLERIEEEVHSLMNDYLSFQKTYWEHERIVKETAKSLTFPFETSRPGQGKMSKCVYKSAEDGGLFFLEAPTGIGKTISSIYPAYKAIGNGKIDRIF
nr:PD-(D/E)XK nuclease family protein [Bacilli bacterium]